MSNITFYTNKQSRGGIISWLIAELGIAVDTIELEYGSTAENGMKSPDFLAINPMGKVPTIVHNTEQGDVVVTETAAICAYLADVFPEKNLAPALTDPQRGTYYRWLFFTAGCVEPATFTNSMGWTVPEDKKMTAGFGCFEDVYNTLKQAVVSANPYICGEQFTAADVYVASQIFWTTSFGVMDSCPEFDSYLENMKQRPAFAAMMG